MKFRFAKQALEATAKTHRQRCLLGASGRGVWGLVQVQAFRNTAQVRGYDKSPTTAQFINEKFISFSSFLWGPTVPILESIEPFLILVKVVKVGPECERGYLLLGHGTCTLRRDHA